MISVSLISYIGVPHGSPLYPVWAIGLCPICPADAVGGASAYLSSNVSPERHDWYCFKFLKNQVLR